MKVLVVATWYPTTAAPHVGVFVRRDVALLARTHDVRLLHLVPPGQRDQESLPVEGVHISQIPMGTSRPVELVSARRTVAKWLDWADILHTMAISSLMPLAFVPVSVPWVHTEHWGGFLTPSADAMAVRLGRRFVLPLLRRPDVLVVVSSELAAAARRYRGDRTIRVIGNAVPRPQTLLPAPRSTPTRLIGVGRLVPTKRPDLALAAVAELNRRGVATTLDWYGDGPMFDALVRHTEALDMESIVTWHGRVPEQEVSSALSRSDLLLAPTESETFGVAIAEALAHGRPVVVGSSGAHTAFVPPEYGETVSEISPEAYADAVVHVLRRTIGVTPESIAQTVSSLWDEAARGIAYEAVYSEARYIGSW